MAFYLRPSSTHLLRAGKEVAFFSGAVMATPTVLLYRDMLLETYCYNQKIGAAPRTDLDKKFLEYSNKLDSIQGFIPIALYGGMIAISHLYQQPGSRVKLLLSIPQRRPLPVPQALGVGLTAFIAAPMLSIFNNIVNSPLIELYHTSTNNSKNISKTKIYNQARESNAKRQELAPRTSEDTQNSAERNESPPPISVGTQRAPELEAAIPGSITLIIPLAEEILYRGLLFSRLVPNIGYLPAALTSSALFGYAHKGADGSNYLPIREANVGLVCSILFYRTGRLLVPIAFHSGYNCWSMLLSAGNSSAFVAGNKWVCAELLQGKCQTKSPELTFWERRATEAFRTVMSAAMFVALWSKSPKTISSQVAPFLPEAFLGQREAMSRQSVFADPSSDGMFFAPVLCDTDGTPTKFAEYLIERIGTEARFGEEESISVNTMNRATHVRMLLQLLFHRLASTPDQIAAKPNPSGADFLEWAEQDIFEGLSEKQRSCFAWRYLSTLGYNVMYFPSGKVTRSEFRKGYFDRLRLGLHSEVNSELFAIYCVARWDFDRDIRVSDLLKEYCSLEQHFLLENKQHDESGLSQPAL